MNIRHIDLKPHSGGLTQLTIVVDGDRSVLGELVGKIQTDPAKYDLELKRIHQKRGLTANAYYWVLVEKLSKVLMTSKDEVHQIMMERYGTLKMADGKPIVFSLLAGADPKTVTAYSKAFAEGEINGKRFVHYAVIKGSSEMDSKEFNDLLQGVRSEAADQGIEVMTPAELAKLEYENRIAG